MYDAHNLKLSHRQVKYTNEKKQQGKKLWVLLHGQWFQKYSWTTMFVDLVRFSFKEIDVNS